MSDPILIVYDFETTGLNPAKCEPVQIGAVALNARTLKEVSRFTAYMRPLKADPEDAEVIEALKINQLTYEFVSKQAHPNHVAEDFRTWARQWDRPIAVGYNLQYDEELMKRWCPGIRWAYRKIDVLHLSMAHLFLPGHMESVALEKVAAELGIDHNPHDALSDSLATADVLRLLTGTDDAVDF